MRSSTWHTGNAAKQLQETVPQFMSHRHDCSSKFHTTCMFFPSRGFGRCNGRSCSSVHESTSSVVSVQNMLLRRRIETLECNIKRLEQQNDELQALLQHIDFVLPPHLSSHAFPAQSSHYDFGLAAGDEGCVAAVHRPCVAAAPVQLCGDAFLAQ